MNMLDIISLFALELEGTKNSFIALRCRTRSDRVPHILPSVFKVTCMIAGTFTALTVFVHEATRHSIDGVSQCSPLLIP